MREFSRLKPCQDTIDFILQFYSNKENLSRAKNFTGRFYTKIPKAQLIERIQNQGTLIALTEKWNCTAEDLKNAFATINQPIEFPTIFYEEEPHVLREFWNLALICSIAEKFKWNATEARQKTSLLWALLTTCAQQIRRSAKSPLFHDF